MKKQIQYLIFTILVSTLVGSMSVFAATTPTQSKITDTKSQYYYNNNLQQNGALSQAAKDFAAANPKEAAAIVAGNNNQCGIQCAAAMEAAAKSSNNKTGAGGFQGPCPEGQTPGTNGCISDAGNTNSDFQGPCPAGQSPGKNGCMSDSKDNLLGIEASRLRQGDVNMYDIAKVILNIIQFLLAIAGTVAVFSLIYHAVKMQLNSGITGDSSGVEAAKKGMTGAIIGFVIAISAWFLVTRVVQILIEVS